MNNYTLKYARIALSDCSIKEEHSQRPWSDQLYVNVIVIEGPKTLCIVSVDITELNTHETLKIRKRSAKLLGINYKNIWITFTHTHAAWYGVSLLDVSKLSDAILIATAAAKVARPQPINSVGLATVDTASKYAVNRRAYIQGIGSFSVFQPGDCLDDGQNVDVTQSIKMELTRLGANEAGVSKLNRIFLNGKVDGILQLMLFGFNTTPVAGFVRFNAHPVIVSSGYYKPHFSRDYCGILCDNLSEMWKCPIAFLQGAAGNQKTRHTCNTMEECEHFGRILASELGPENVSINFENIDKIELANESIKCSIHDYIMWDKDKRLGQIKNLEHEIKSLSINDDYLKIFKKLSDQKKALEDVELNISELGYLTAKDIERGYCETEMSAVKIGKFIIVAANHELSNFFSLRLYKEFSPDCLIVMAYTNGCDGYVLDENDFRKGGYEQAASVIAPENSEKILSAVRKIVAKCKLSFPS